MSQESLSHALDTGIRASPPLTISVASFAGLPLESWVYICTIIYTIVQIGFTAWTWSKDRNRYKRRKANRESNDDRYKNN